MFLDLINMLFLLKFIYQKWMTITIYKSGQVDIFLFCDSKIPLYYLVSVLQYTQFLKKRTQLSIKQDVTRWLFSITNQSIEICYLAKFIFKYCWRIVEQQIILLIFKYIIIPVIKFNIHLDVKKKSSRPLLIRIYNINPD